MRFFATRRNPVWKSRRISILKILGGIFLAAVVCLSLWVAWHFKDFIHPKAWALAAVHMSPLTIAKILTSIVIPGVLGVMGYHLAALAVPETRKRRMWRAAFILLTILGIGGAVAVEIRVDVEHKGEIKEHKEEVANQREQNTHMTQTLQDGQATSKLLAQQFGDFRNDLKSLQGKRLNPTGPTISVSEIARLEERAKQAENAANWLSIYYGQHEKIQNWPFGATSNNPDLHSWFLDNFSEAENVNGQDRLFLYYLAKHDGMLTSYKEIDDLYQKTFPGIFGTAAMESEHRLENLGFIQRYQPGDRFMAKLKEPYYSRFKGKSIP
jgi:hypothetical protein